MFKCRGCTFRGPVVASDVVFARTVDLSGSTFEQGVDFRGATFKAPALFSALSVEEDGRPRERRAEFRGPADFSLVFFEELASFSRATFRDAVFRDTRFADATFESTTFSEATFGRAAFRGTVVFNGATFTEQATFEEADFSRRTDFSQARFRDGAVFARAQFGAGASFLATWFFSRRVQRPAASFQGVASTGDLNFTFALFRHGGAGDVSGVVAVFSSLVCAGSLVLRDAGFPTAYSMTMNRLQVRDLVVDVGIVPQIDDETDQRAVLGSIEESAKARGDLASANDAHYALRVLRSEDYSAMARALDYVFYRGIAGYLVRPGRPLLVLLGLVVLASILRTARRAAESRSEPAATGSRLGRLWRGAGRRCGDLLTCLLDTSSLVVPRWGGGGPDVRLARRLEVVTYRLLLVCVLLGLANSNPTLRQMVDTLF